MSQATSAQLVEGGLKLAMTGLVHRVSEPVGNGPHPTVVMLHGRSGDEGVMWIFSRVLPQGWLVVSPRGIKEDPDGGYAWHPRQRDEWPPLSKFDKAVAAVTSFVSALPNVYDADLERVFLMGFSQGAATAYATAMAHPGMIKGIAGLVGFIPSACDEAIEVKALEDLPIFMAVGRKDRLIPIERTLGCAETLKVSGARLTYREYDTGHRLNAQGMRDLKAWWAEREAG